MNLSKISLKYSILIISVIGILFSLILNIPTQHSNTRLSSYLIKANLDFPISLKIPSINIDANIEQVGLAPDGSMDVPKQPDDVAWFNLGTKPGEVGSAVIAGHSGYKNNRPAVFDKLYKLQKGDKIYIEDEQRKTTTFFVREIRNYDSKAEATSVFNSSDGLSHLNLITCSGIWDATGKTHSERLVVFTDMEIK